MSEGWPDSLHLGDENKSDGERSCSEPRFVQQQGFLVFTGTLATEEIPDHRALREERVESLLKSVVEGRL